MDNETAARVLVKPGWSWVMDLLLGLQLGLVRGLTGLPPVVQR